MKSKKSEEISKLRAEKMAEVTASVFRDVTEELINAVKYGGKLSPESLQLISRYAEILQQSVYKEIFSEFLKLYGDNAKEITKALSDKTKNRVVYSDADLQVMDAMIQTDFEKVSTTVDAMGSSVRREVMNGVLLGEKPTLDLSDLSKQLKSYVYTEIRTGEMGFYRTVNNSKSIDAGFERFEYVGPLDGIVRDFCEEHVGKVYTIKEIQSLDNGQGLDVFQFGGGYNCRHSWEAVE